MLHGRIILQACHNIRCKIDRFCHFQEWQLYSSSLILQYFIYFVCTANKNKITIFFLWQCRLQSSSPCFIYIQKTAALPFSQNNNKARKKAGKISAVDHRESSTTILKYVVAFYRCVSLRYS